MKNFLELVNNRQSDRAYENRAIEYEKIRRILECARVAPSACNAQPWKFIVVDNPELKFEVDRAAKVFGMNHFVGQSPVHIVIVEEKANYTSRIGGVVWNKHFPLIDIGIAAEHICLAAADEGLGSCMLGWFDEKKVKKLLDIPNSKRAPLIITLGYPAKKKREKKRKNIDDIVSFNKYRK